jgi:hypothetical protein
MSSRCTKSKMNLKIMNGEVRHDDESPAIVCCCAIRLIDGVIRCGTLATQKQAVYGAHYRNCVGSLWRSQTWCR